jgi:hypothetical protein
MTKVDTSYYRSEPRRWHTPKPVRHGGFSRPKPSPISYRIVDSAHYDGNLEMPAQRQTIYIVSREGLGDCWWTKDHPRAMPVAVYNSLVRIKKL